MENPFSITFGQKPAELISRNNQLSQIISTFEMERPTNHVYMIAGVRGSGKTVSLAEISEHFKQKKNWLVINLNPDSNMLKEAVSEIRRQRKPHHLEISANIQPPVGGSLSVKRNEPNLTDSSELKDLLDDVEKKSQRVLFVVDEIITTEAIRLFAGEFQIWLRENRPVYLVMAGLYENISSLQDEKTLTFLYRAPKIALKPLSIPAIAARYQTVFHISEGEAAEMAKATKGYSFAFQILGFLRWEERKPLAQLIPQYDADLAEYAYDKIWSELSLQDRTVAKIIASGKNKTGDIRQALGVSTQYMNVYRRRLIAKGIVDGETHGTLNFTLPRFEVYIQLYCE